MRKKRRRKDGKVREEITYIFGDGSRIDAYVIWDKKTRRVIYARSSLYEKRRREKERVWGLNMDSMHHFHEHPYLNVEKHLILARNVTIDEYRALLHEKAKELARRRGTKIVYISPS